ncbi:MAG: GNAT family N-acetyltransferase [Nocardioidaceae bacterium]
MSISTPTRYEILVDRHLDDHWSDWFGDVTIHRRSDGSSSITATMVDQAQLHGLLAGLRDINASLVSLRATDTPLATESGRQPAVWVPTLTRSLVTSRVTLRPATEADAGPTWALRQLDSVNEWLTGCPPDLGAYRALFAQPDRLATTVVAELNNPANTHTGSRVLGDFMLQREDWAQREVTDEADGGQAELGWVLDPARAGHGYAAEALLELIRYSFNELGLRRVVATCFLGNDSSWRLMERVGMSREAHAVRDSLHRSGQWLDTVTYALLSDEWLAKSDR